MRTLLGLAAVLLLTACVSIGLGGEPAAHAQLSLRDAGAGATRRPEPVVNALLVQPQPGDPMAETLSMAYSRRADEYAFYQLASWTERPVRQLPRLLQRRLEARGVAGAVGLIGDPLQADWLLAIRIDTMFHDVSSPPGEVRFAMTADVFDRRSRMRVAHRQFQSNVPTAVANSAAAAQALSIAVARTFDELVPWTETQLQRVSVTPH